MLTSVGYEAIADDYMEFQTLWNQTKEKPVTVAPVTGLGVSEPFEKGPKTMSELMITRIEVFVNGSAQYALRDCPACGESIKVPFVGVGDAEALFRLATDRDKLCFLCADEVAYDIAMLEIEQALIGHSFANVNNGTVGEVTEVDHDLGDVVMQVFHDPDAGNWNRVNYTERVSLDSFETHFEQVATLVPVGDWGTGYERQVERDMIGV